MGMAGVLVILRPGLEIVTDEALVVLLGALCYGVSNVMMKSLTADDAPWVIVFWMQIIQLPLAALTSRVLLRLGVAELGRRAVAAGHGADRDVGAFLPCPGLSTC